MSAIKMVFMEFIVKTWTIMCKSFLLIDWTCPFPRRVIQKQWTESSMVCQIMLSSASEETLSKINIGVFGDWDRVRFFFFPSFYFLCFFVKSVYYFTVGKNKINKNRQSVAMMRAGNFILSLLSCSSITLYPWSDNWQLGTLPRLCQVNTQNLLADSRSHQMPNLDVW